MSEPDPIDFSQLCPEDAAALDALVESGFDPHAAPAQLRARARRLAETLGLLEPMDSAHDAQSRAALVHATLHAARDADATHADGPTLSTLDAAALDALIDARWDADAVPHTCVSRARRLSVALMSLEPTLDEPLSHRVARIDATLLRIDRAGAHRSAGFRLAPPLESEVHPRGVRARFWDIVSVAAMVLIGVSIIWPAATHLRDQARRSTAESRFAASAFGFSQFANDHDDRLPRAPQSLAGLGSGLREWWHVGDPAHSNSANLFILVSQGYVTLTDLSSPGNPHAPVRLDLSRHQDWRTPREVSYSYRLFGSQTPRWSGQTRFVVISDRSPVVPRARRGERIDATLNSRNHRGAGQFVLWNDGSSQWLDSPYLPGGDNLWLPRHLERTSDPVLRGVERPADATDAFVGP